MKILQNQETVKNDGVAKDFFVMKKTSGDFSSQKFRKWVNSETVSQRCSEKL